ncbi:hypothetical protein FVE85_9144 [Porphyridium purpureum]|uniref:Uncharacterized protein n=1 Tax=Porphyridium purpureum TaxID=35688 RepID=A0A5J4YPR9_PORPP|nr:hypothetical protein FVE85_9144 [Porphyridium purpureum]|eukprot:POR4312..scf222_8
MEWTKGADEDDADNTSALVLPQQRVVVRRKRSSGRKSGSDGNGLATPKSRSAPRSGSGEIQYGASYPGYAASTSIVALVQRDAAAMRRVSEQSAGALVERQGVMACIIDAYATARETVMRLARTISRAFCALINNRHVRRILVLVEQILLFAGYSCLSVLSVSVKLLLRLLYWAKRAVLSQIVPELRSLLSSEQKTDAASSGQ